MKKGFMLGIVALILTFGAAVYAQGPGMMGGYGMGPGMMGPGYGGGYGMGPGMMGGYGGGYGMGPGMMGPGWGGGYGMGPGMMGGYGNGYGRGPGMMGPGWGGGYGMGPGMMGPGWGGRQGYGQGYGQSEECQKYFDETAGMRKELNNKRFDYYEALRNPKTKPEEVTKLEKEIWELQQKIYSKAPAACR